MDLARQKIAIIKEELDLTNKQLGGTYGRKQSAFSQILTGKVKIQVDFLMVLVKMDINVQGILDDRITVEEFRKAMKIKSVAHLLAEIEKKNGEIVALRRELEREKEITNTLMRTARP